MLHLVALTYSEVAMQGMKPIAAWVVRGERDEEIIWAVSCLQEIRDRERGETLVLLEPIYVGDHGSWNWEYFRRKGCEHCKQFTKHAAPVKLVANSTGTFSIQDPKGAVLVGLRDISTTDFPKAMFPDNWDLIPEPIALLIQGFIEEGQVTPVFKRR